MCCTEGSQEHSGLHISSREEVWNNQDFLSGQTKASLHESLHKKKKNKASEGPTLWEIVSCLEETRPDTPCEFFSHLHKH